MRADPDLTPRWCGGGDRDPRRRVEIRERRSVGLWQRSSKGAPGFPEARRGQTASAPDASAEKAA